LCCSGSVGRAGGKTSEGLVPRALSRCPRETGLLWRETLGFATDSEAAVLEP
jgi:hypothetical protein